jgi:CheY-like chemotaxis protein
LKTNLARHRVLVVDDNVDAAQSLGMLLKLSGHDVSVAHNGHDGLQQASEFRPELVLLDIGMPVMDGYEVCRRLRQDPRTQGALVIALTGWGLEEDRQRSLDEGFDQHLVKPVELQTLVKLLEELD